MTTYTRTSDGATVTFDEAHDARGFIKAGYGIRVPHRFMDSARTEVTDVSITDAARVVADAEPMRFGCLDRIIAEVKSPHRDVALGGARQARDQAQTLTMFAEGHFRPSAMTADGHSFKRDLTDAEKAQFRRLSDHLAGLAAAAETRAAAGGGGQHGATPATLTPDQAYAAMVARDATAWRA